MARRKRDPKQAAAGFAAAASEQTPDDRQHPAALGHSTPSPTAPTAAPEGRKPQTGKKVRPHSKQALIYLHPDGHRALKLYAAEADRSMQDVVSELLERGAKQLGITAPMRPSPPDESES